MLSDATKMLLQQDDRVTKLRKERDVLTSRIDQLRGYLHQVSNEIRRIEGLDSGAGLKVRALTKRQGYVKR